MTLPTIPPGAGSAPTPDVGPECSAGSAASARRSERAARASLKGAAVALGGTVAALVLVTRLWFQSPGFAVPDGSWFGIGAARPVGPSAPPPPPQMHSPARSADGGRASRPLAESAAPESLGSIASDADPDDSHEPAAAVDPPELAAVTPPEDPGADHGRPLPATSPTGEDATPDPSPPMTGSTVRYLTAREIRATTDNPDLVPAERGKVPAGLQGTWLITRPSATATPRPESEIRITAAGLVFRMKVKPGLLDATFDGMPMTAVTDNDLVQWLEGPHYRMQVDTSTNPWLVDLAVRAKTGKVISKKGVCELQGDTLRINVGAPGEARPSGLDAAGSWQATRRKQQP